MASRIESTTGLGSHPFRMLFQHGALGRLDDGQLLEQFLAGREDSAEAAFRSLVDRHGPMVLRICQNVMGDRHDAEDASQAVFFVLARRAADLRHHESAASWLFGVAQRVACQAKRHASRRRRHEERWGETNARSVAEMAPSDGWEALYEEVARLPEKYRDAIVLCYLEGLRHDQAAAQLGCPVKTLETRLQRAKARLRERLVRRGLTPALGLLAMEHLSRAASAGVPAALREATVRVALHFSAGNAIATGVVADAAVVIAERISRSLLWGNVRAGAIAGLALCVAVGGVGVSLAYQQGRQERRVAVAKLPAPAQESAKPTAKVPEAKQRLTDSEAPILVSLPPRAELHAILRKAADEAIAIARDKPIASSDTLTYIAAAQAKVGDLDGARATFAVAVQESAGELGGNSYAWNVWRIANAQVEAGLNPKKSQNGHALQAGALGDLGKNQTASAYSRFSGWRLFAVIELPGVDKFRRGGQAIRLAWDRQEG